MKRLLYVLAFLALAAAGVFSTVALGIGETTGTVSATATACADASTPAHTISDNGTPVYTIAASSDHQCSTTANTTTYTIPTVTAGSGPSAYFTESFNGTRQALWTVYPADGSGFQYVDDGTGTTAKAARLFDASSAQTGLASGGQLVSVYTDSNHAYAGQIPGTSNGQKQETWYREHRRFPTGFKATAGNWNWITEWHVDGTTEADGQRLGKSIVSCGLRIVSSGTITTPNGPGTNPYIQLVLRGGPTSAPIEAFASMPSNSLTAMIGDAKWQDFVFHVVWSTGTDAMIELWVNANPATAAPTLKVVSPTQFTRSDGTLSYANTYGQYNYRTVANFASSIDSKDVSAGPTLASIYP